MSTETKRRASAIKKLTPANKIAVYRPPPATATPVLSKQDVCDLLRISPRQLAKMVSSGDYPTPDAHMGKRPRWSVDTHNEWVSAKLAEGRKAKQQG